MLLLLPVLVRRLELLGTRLYTNTIVLQSAINNDTLEVLYNALVVTRTQLSLGCVS